MTGTASDKQQQIVVGGCIWVASYVLALVVFAKHFLEWLKTDNWPTLTNRDVWYVFSSHHPHTTWLGLQHAFHWFGDQSFPITAAIAGTVVGWIMINDA